MITRTEAERIAASINLIRTDWPVASLVTLISRDLDGWPLLDVYVGLAHVAIERTATGSWVSQTPARVKENGPWRRIEGVAGEAEQTRTKADRDREARLAEIAVRNQAIARCVFCDDEGRLDGGHTCPHDLPPDERARRAAEHAAEARALIRPAPQPIDQPREDHP